ncbi:tyrosine-type recombinase/integrase [Oryzobacter sp. R7]|uniref:tyrosine-type recombinase/integrase n=1 Tax=Oryzobacter faecalis TaxID=3388656 RepID=UPI00398D1DC8
MSGQRRARRGFGYIRKLPSGRYQASYMAPDFRRLKAPDTFASKADAEGWLGTERYKIMLGDWERPEPPPRRTEAFAEFAKSWVATRDLKPRTREGYLHLLETYLLPRLGREPVADITPAMVRTWWISMPVERPTSRARAYSLLKAIMNTAVSDDLIAANPCRIRGGSSTPREREIRPASIDELQVIVEHLPERYRALVLICAWCALRQGEVLELRRSDVDLVRGTIRVERALTWVHGKAIVGTPKSAAGTRTVAVPPHIEPAIKHHLWEFTASSPKALLFPSADSEAHLQPSTLYKSWRAAREAAGRPDLRLHDLRHTGATMAAMAGATLAELQQRLGHSSVNAALRYQHAAAGRDRQIADALSALARAAESSTA